MFQAPIDTDAIVVTAARAPEEIAATAASVTILDQERIERLGEPLIPNLLRLTPSAAVATSGPAGSLTEVRIRGAEANHTLLFIDGIRANDPAAGNTPRFELLNADIASRVEVVRGPQSALWGSEAIGGVVAVEGLDGTEATLTAAGEAGSFGFRRASAEASGAAGPLKLAVALGVQRAKGIDSFDGEGDRDGFRNLSGRLRATWAVSPSLEFGAAGIALSGRSQFDGYLTVPPFTRADTLDNSRNELVAGRLWARVGAPASPWSGHLATSLLGSSNRNYLDTAQLNRTSGRRWTLAGQVERRFTSGEIEHRLIAAAEHEREEFHARDRSGFANQDRNRSRQALTVEWRAAAGPLVGYLALRRDWFNRFKDATTLRASLLAELGGGFSLAGSYGQGIAQPTFFDLYGFYPGSFVGNPALKPETSRGFEASVRYRRDQLDAALTWYRQRLRDEIVDNATFTSTLNAEGASRRSGFEANIGWQPSQHLRLAATYAYAKSTQPKGQEGQVAELRRPKHSGSIAVDGTSDRLTYGASLAYTGPRLDTGDVFPFDRVRLAGYWLGGARLAYRVAPRLELFARAANAFDANYQDVFGYRTEGRSLYAGIRLADRP